MSQSQNGAGNNRYGSNADQGAANRGMHYAGGGSGESTGGSARHF